MFVANLSKDQVTEQYPYSLWIGHQQDRSSHAGGSILSYFGAVTVTGSHIIPGPLLLSLSSHPEAHLFSSSDFFLK